MLNVSNPTEEKNKHKNLAKQLNTSERERERKNLLGWVIYDNEQYKNDTLLFSNLRNFFFFFLFLYKRSPFYAAGETYVSACVYILLKDYICTYARVFSKNSFRKPVFEYRKTV